MLICLVHSGVFSGVHQGMYLEGISYLVIGSQLAPQLLTPCGDYMPTNGVHPIARAV